MKELPLVLCSCVVTTLSGLGIMVLQEVYLSVTREAAYLGKTRDANALNTLKQTRLLIRGVMVGMVISFYTALTALALTVLSYLSGLVFGRSFI